MWANDTNYTVIKNGVLVVSGTGPAIRVDRNKLVIRDGPKETRPLALARAEASRKLRHVIMAGTAGGYATFDAFRWLRDTGVSFSHIDWDGSIVIASGPRGRDQPNLRRAQVLVCSGVIPDTAIAITREIVRVKLAGQAEVVGYLGSTDASAAIAGLAEDVARETDGGKVLAVESRAASIYWKAWETVPVRFAHQNPERLAPNGRWRPGRPDYWLSFGPRSSLLTGRPHRASTPGNALLNYLYGVLAGEMTIALNAVGLDPGIGIFHSDIDRRASLALDAIEAARPYVDHWLLDYLASSAFANRDFTELPDGEVRLTHPLNAHLAHTAALWRKACEPVADWLAHSFGRAVDSGAVLSADTRMVRVPKQGAVSLVELARPVTPLGPLPNLRGTGRGRQPIALQAGVAESPVPRMCSDCGKMLSSRRRKFCSETCAVAFHLATTTQSPAATSEATSSNATPSKHGNGDKSRRHLALRRAWIAEHVGPAGATLNGARNAWPTASGVTIDQLREWFETTVRPLLAKCSLADIRNATELSTGYVIRIRRGRTPHPRHFEALAKLAGVKAPAL